MLKKNQRIEITIESLGSEGQGIGKSEGFIVFVEGGLPGELLEIQLVKLKKNYGYGKLLRVIEPSPNRMEPVCPVFSKCGGCNLMHMSYEAQLEYKTEKVSQALRRIGGFKDIKTEPAIGMSEPFRYRNKGQFPCALIDGRVRFGLYSLRSHRLVPVRDCLIQRPANERVLKTLEGFMEEHNLSAYDEETHKGLIRNVVIKEAFNTGEIMVVIVANDIGFPCEEALASALMSIEGVCSVILNVNQKRTNVILGKESRVLKGKGRIRETLGKLRFEISPLSFFQVNPVQTKVLYDKVVEFADFHKEDTVIDAYCGIGSIALYIADKVKKVYGIEISPEAIEDGKKNAVLNSIGNGEFFAGAAEEHLPMLLNEKTDIVILDPPRKGCEEELLKALLRSGPEKVIYVSCNPATLARDLKILCGEGCPYKIEKVQPVDCFCQSWHVETVVLMTRKTG